MMASLLAATCSYMVEEASFFYYRFMMTWTDTLFDLLSQTQRDLKNIAVYGCIT
jgi:hypothetical protein